MLQKVLDKMLKENYSAVQRYDNFIFRKLIKLYSGTGKHSVPVSSATIQAFLFEVGRHMNK